MSLIGDIGNNIYNGLSTGAAIGVRDVGHAINLGQNLITGQGIHGNNDGNWGSALINVSHTSGYGGSPILDLAYQAPSGTRGGSKPTAGIQQLTTSQIPIYGTVGTGSSGGAVPVDLSQYDAAINQYNNALSRLPGQLGIAEGNINTQYGQNLNEINSARDQAQNNYNDQTTQNSQSYVTNKNQIKDQASQGLRGLQRMLGAYGAGGSSDALYVAPQAVATQQTTQNAGAGQNFATNARTLDTNWNNFLADDKNSRAKLHDWQSQQLQSAQSQSDTTKQSLLSQLAAVKGQRAAAAGGSYAAGAQPYIDQANALSGQIDALARLNPTYTGTTAVYKAPTLDSYTAGQGTAATIDPGAQGATPYLAALLGQQQKDKNGATA